MGEPASSEAVLDNGVSLIAAERERQMRHEGYTAAHDRHHAHDEMAMAAVSKVALRDTLHSMSTYANTAHPDYGRRRAAQEKIQNYCSCDRLFVGNAAWASHRRAHPDHRAVSRTAILERAATLAAANRSANVGSGGCV